MNFEVVPASAVEPLLVTWRSWASRVSPFASPGFFTAWVRAFGATRTAFVIAGRNGATLEYILPCWHTNDRPREWQTFGSYRADYTEALTASEDPEIARAFWRWLERDAPCDLAKVARFPTDSFLGRAAPNVGGRRQRVLRSATLALTARRLRTVATSFHDEHPYADRARIEDLADRLDAKYMRRNAKMLEKVAGTLEYTVLHGQAIAPRLDTFFAMHVQNFAGTGRTSQFESEHDRDFYRFLVENRDLEGSIQMDILSGSGRPLAMHVGFQHANQIYYYKPTFDLELGKASPGKLLLAHIFARAKQQNVTCFDLLKGTEAYKAEWASHSRPTSSVSITERKPRDLVQAVTRRWGS